MDQIVGTPTLQDFTLSVYPNPFTPLDIRVRHVKGHRIVLSNGVNPSTQIRFVTKKDDLATLRIYNLSGQLIRALLQESRVAGEHTVPWDGRDERGATVASGVYFIRFEAGNEAKISKVMLAR
ncbi:MAG: T9SS type A sorting domain-containing protein [candidate division KSB1 bacterium]|nr:T9SS type A sorting domain-containing protein [candidate division KSB1 bacterium]MDZ7305293.1 T9SS type A sorting domain-containing protein [candidate division KSB1 bacterium]MDZ7314386.1 T9SS type A sorting domain-containing protein [candidate division KSB1 bacterium]